MSGTLSRAVGAELSKLLTLPSVVLSVAGTVLAAAGIAAGLATTAAAALEAAGDGEAGIGAAGIVAQAIPFLQAGLILLGALAVASEYAGRQIVTSLVSTPGRLRLLCGKAAAFLVVGVATSAAAVGAAFATASVVLRLHDVAPGADAGARTIVGGILYLTAMGLLALAVAVLLRTLLAPLVAMLGLVLLVSPLLAGRTEHARWLPDRAGTLLYRRDADPVLDPATGALVLLCWLLAALLAAAVAFARRDA